MRGGRDAGPERCARQDDAIAVIASRSARALDRGATLHDGRDEYGGVLEPEHSVGVLPGAWAAPDDRSNRRRCRDEVPPGADAVAGVVGNVRASLED